MCIFYLRKERKILIIVTGQKSNCFNEFVINYSTELKMRTAVLGYLSWNNSNPRDWRKTSIIPTGLSSTEHHPCHVQRELNWALVTFPGSFSSVQTSLYCPPILQATFINTTKWCFKASECHWVLPPWWLPFYDQVRPLLGTSWLSDLTLFTWPQFLFNSCKGNKIRFPYKLTAVEQPRTTAPSLVS